MFMAMISTMLGLMNLLPVPMLDGGHLAFYGIEAIMRRPVHEAVQEWSFRAGFAFLISLMLYVTYNDIISLVQRFILS
jgi:regulator of sigma E protease